jgi:hypothetical protein
MHVDGESRQELAKLDVHVGEGLQSFEVEEGWTAWPQLKRIIERFDALDIVSTQATVGECAAATWLHVIPDWHHGYPMPDDDFGYLELTYELANYCPSCGLGAVQNAPFRMRGEPKWGRRAIVQLNWVFDEYFVTPEVWKAIFEPHAIPARRVLRHSTGQTLTTVVQLVIDGIASTPVQLGHHRSEWCQRCERRKYVPFVRGCFPAFVGAPGNASLFKESGVFRQRCVRIAGGDRWPGTVRCNNRSQDPRMPLSASVC